MATARKRDVPFGQFNFTVSWEGLEDNTVEAGFQEVSGLGVELNVAEYRAGNHTRNSPVKVTGSFKVPDVTLKRGVVGASDLFDWLAQIRDGQQAKKSVTIRLLSEDRETTVQEWELQAARPTKYTGPSLNGKGTDVAVEELVLASEHIELKS